MNIQLTLAWRYLKGRGLRTLLTTLAVVLAVMLMFGLNGILPGMMQAFSASMLRTAGKVDITVSSSLGDTFGLDVQRRIARVLGIAVAAPVLERTVTLPPRIGVPAASQVSQVGVIGVDPFTAAKVRDFSVASGRFLTPADADSVVLASDLAGKFGVRLGGQLAVPSAVGSTRLTVIGLLGTPTVPGQEQLFVTLSTAQRMFGETGRISTVEAAIVSGADRAVVQDAVTHAVGSNFTIGGVSTLGQLAASLQIGQAAMNMFGLFALATGGFIILNTFRTVVAERRHDVGMLRALGATRGTIVGMFLSEAVIQGVIGTGLGLLAGWGMAAAGLAAMAPIYETYLHLQAGGPVFETSTWVISIVLGVGVTVLGALIPAMSAGRVTPLEALRPQASGIVYKRTAGRRAWIGAALIAGALLGLATRQSGLVGLGSVLFLVGIALVAPRLVAPLSDIFSNLIEIAFAREGAVARSNIQRNPGRSAITVSAVMLGLAAVVAMAGVITSIFGGFLTYLDKSLGSDYILIPRSIILSTGNVGAGPKLANEVRHVPGIGSVATLRLGTGKIAGRTVQAIGIDPVVYPRVATFDWAGGSNDSATGHLADGRTLIANGVYAAQNAVKIGDRVVFDTPTGPKTYRVIGVGSDYLNAKLSTVYISQDNLAKDFNQTNDLLVLADLLPGADRAAVERRLQTIVQEFTAFTLYSSKSWRAEQQAIFDQTIGVFYVLIAALALPSLLALLNTLAMSVLARTREIGMLRAVGSTRRQIRRMVMAESLLLTAIGTSFGILSGVWLGYALVTAMSSAGFPLPYYFPWAGILVTIAVGMGFGVLAALIPARSAAKLNIVDALHFE